MPSGRLNIPLPNKGVNIDVPGEFLDPREATFAKNGASVAGEIMKRYGIVLSDANPILMRVMNFAQLVKSPNVYLLRFDLRNVMQYNQSTNEWSMINIPQSTGDASDPFSFAYPHIGGERVIVYTNGIDPMYYWTGSSVPVVLSVTAPRAKYIMQFGDYLLAANQATSGFPYRLQWTDTGDPTAWTPNVGNARVKDFIDDGRDITGLGRFGNFATVHKESCIYIGYPVTTTDVIRWERRETGVGTVANGTICNLPTGDQIYLARDGIRTFNGTSSSLIPVSLNRELRRTLNAQHLNRAQAIVVPDREEYWCAVATGASDNIEKVYKWNWRDNTFWMDERPDLSAMSLYTSTTQLTIDELVGTTDHLNFRLDDVFFNSLTPTPIFGFYTGKTAKESAGTYSDQVRPFVADDDDVFGGGGDPDPAETAISATEPIIHFVFDTKDFTAQDFQNPDMGTLMRFSAMQVWAAGGGDLAVSYSIDSGMTWTLAETITTPQEYPSDDAPLYAYFDFVSSKARFRFENNVADEFVKLKKFVPEASGREMRR